MALNRLGLGTKHWLFQRFSNALFVIFGLWLAVVLYIGISYEFLLTLLDNTVIELYLAITLVFATLNSVLAGWQITGDYAKKFHINGKLMNTFCVLVSFAYLVVGLILIF